VKDLCQDCWQERHPDDYAPEMRRYGECATCGYLALVTRDRSFTPAPWVQKALQGTLPAKVLA
jgi:hypothetical protein